MLRDVLSADDVVLLTRLGQPKHFPPGTEIFREGEEGTVFFCIETGEVEVSRIGTNGRKVVLNHLSQGDLMGEMALLDRGARSATCTALTDTTGLLLTFDDLRAFLLQRPELLFAFTLRLVAKLRSTNDMFEDMSQKDAGVRLARCFLRLAPHTSGGAQRVALALSQSEIGDIVGLSRANVNRYMRAWAKEGLISVERDAITIQDLAALERLAER